MRRTASPTACSHSGADSAPSCQLTMSGGSGGSNGAGCQGVSPSGVMVVSQAFPVPSRPRIALGTMSTEPSDASSKVKLPNATRPEPRRRTSSSTCAPSMSSRSHFSPSANRSAPAGSVTRAASPHPTRPAPCRIHARASGTGISRQKPSPGSGTGVLRTSRRSDMTANSNGRPAACSPAAGRPSPSRLLAPDEQLPRRARGAASVHALSGREHLRHGREHAGRDPAVHPRTAALGDDQTCLPQFL